MASASSAARLCVLACRRVSRIQQIPRSQQITRQRPLAQRAFTISTIRWAREQDPRQDDGEEEDFGPLELKKLEAALADASTPEGLKHLDELAKENGFNTIDAYLESELSHRSGWASEERSLLEDIMRDDKGEKPNKQSFWFDEEDPETNTEELEEFDEDDITSMAHGKLDEIREMRQYARLAVWELPLLSKFAKPFVPPSDNQVLRWRYTSYMGESHPAEKKVVVQFAPDDLKLTPVQTEKLKKLAGPRYNPETELIKMSSDSFEHQAQNKRYLSNLVDDLIAAAKDPKDTFEDIPLDTRHHKVKPKPRFPKEWRMSAKRRSELDGYRQRLALEDVERANNGLLIDGTQVIDEYLVKKVAEDQKKQKAAELIAAAPAKSSSGSRARRFGGACTIVRSELMRTEYIVNIIIPGAPASGKRSFIRRYCQDLFTDQYDSITKTSGGSRVANISGISTLIHLERLPSTLIDPGPESHRIISENDALILLYDGFSLASLAELRRMRLKVLAPHLRETAPPTAVRDLAELLGAQFGVVPAPWGDGVKDVAEELAAKVLEMK
ncbi:hypothetical protein F66182_9479 [Fusarium sp. NRRL 66182]|nr:hypothetical protein F66182_9479 [Fusarium sp. NRRL 66182]